MSLVEQMNGRFSGVQALRFVAAFLVVVGHATFYTHERLDPGVPVWTWTTIGVDVFFVISGFVMVISSRSLVSRAGGWRIFGLRRVVRIVPMYWIATTVKLLTLVALPGLVLHATLDPSNVVLSYFFLPSRNEEGAVEPLLGVGWTLIYEMFFYAVFTIALLVRARPVIFCGAVLSVLALGSLVRTGDDWAPALVYFDPIVLYFLVGMLIGVFVSGGSRRWFVLGMGWVSALFVAAWAVRVPERSWWESGHFARAGLVIAVMLVVVLLEPRLRRVIPKPALFLGDASYTLYLFHPLIAPAVPVVLAVVGLTNGVLSVAGCIAASIIAAVLIYVVVERPLTRWLQRVTPGLRPHPAGAVEPEDLTAAVSDEPRSTADRETT